MFLCGLGPIICPCDRCSRAASTVFSWAAQSFFAICEHAENTPVHFAQICQLTPPRGGTHRFSAFASKHDCPSREDNPYFHVFMHWLYLYVVSPWRAAFSFVFAFPACLIASRISSELDVRVVCVFLLQTVRDGTEVPPPFRPRKDWLHTADGIFCANACRSDALPQNLLFATGLFREFR